MNRFELISKTDAFMIEMKNALQLVYDELNQGQQKKLLKNEEVKALFEKYNVEVG